ncbi:alcohol dehydrogenase catalytic domain-containing protein [Mycobacterium antarcticum]|uniref:alcohol dehydrogenase catalytic domain-containing protein n=1 Tax=Mycolicibacterium sp. TUM20984 TaxID=3023368 RepID=UPI0024E1030A|nr:alcohol dehydrogenase catalytic domain-containing protein [Mycolicibacterium sp. TUM20984]
MTSIDAMVFHRPNQPLISETLELRAPQRGEVLVRMMASGVCHSDLHVLNGDWPMPENRPIVLGHEGAGVVEAIGEAVVDVAVGDHVALSWFAPCRRCDACLSGNASTCRNTRALENSLPDGSSPLRSANDTVIDPFLGIATFASSAVVPESAVVKIPDAVPFPVAALIGCAVTTGFGAVVRAAKVTPGESAVVLGCGGVGQALISALRLVGATPIIAVDLSDERLALAAALGATVTIDGGSSDIDIQVDEITQGGADFAFEAIGRPKTIELLPNLIRAGGKAILVGLTSTGARASFEPAALVDQGKTLIGCNYGDSVPSIDFPRIARLYLAGALPLDRLIGRVISLGEVNSALDDLKAGHGLRTIIDYS